VTAAAFAPAPADAVSAADVSTLIEMGFSKARAETALRAVAAGVAAGGAPLELALAVEWLEAHPDDNAGTAAAAAAPAAASAATGSAADDPMAVDAAGSGSGAAVAAGAGSGTGEHGEMTAEDKAAIAAAELGMEMVNGVEQPKKKLTVAEVDAPFVLGVALLHAVHFPG
jgi:hypothetical protein